jgi:hypothetical protein
MSLPHLKAELDELNRLSAQAWLDHREQLTLASVPRILAAEIETQVALIKKFHPEYLGLPEKLTPEEIAEGKRRREAGPPQSALLDFIHAQSRLDSDFERSESDLHRSIKIAERV